MDIPQEKDHLLSLKTTNYYDTKAAVTSHKASQCKKTNSEAVTSSIQPSDNYT